MYKALRGQTSGKTETKTLLGKEYLVVPVVAMIEGVRFGANQSSGELGLAAEFGKFTEGWNTSPVVLSHPQIDGEFVSAGSPTVLEDYFLGEIFHTKLEDKKLHMEAWLDVQTKEKGGDFARVFERIEAGETIEVSVGFFTEVEEKTGKLNGQSYTGIWRNIVPDHLAFLKEGEIGACSVEDGCGSPRTNKAKGAIMSTKGQAGRKAADLMGDKKKKAKAYAKPETQSEEGSCSCQNKDMVAVLTSINTQTEAPEFADRAEVRALMTQNFIAQEIPSDLLSSDIIRALAEKLSDTCDWPFVLGYTNDYVVYEAYQESDGWQLYRQNFSISADGEVTFTADPEEVRLITKIVPVSADSGDVNVNSTTQPKETDMTTKSKPKAQQSGEQPAADTTEGGAAATENTETGTETENTEGTAKETANEGGEAAPATQTKKVQSVQEYIEAAPAEMREVLQSSVKLHSQRKETLIANLKKTGRCNLADDFLKSQSLETLEQLAKLADVPSYAGAAAPVRTQTESDEVPAAPKVFGKPTA